MIAVDAMGGDYAPYVVIEGALRAAQRGIPVYLFGDKKKIYTHLDSLYKKWRTLPISIEPCTQIIGMEEEATRSVVRKKDASLVRAAQSVKDGRTSALVSAGNSGAVLVASTLIIGRVEGVIRPALGNFVPTHNGSIFCLDLGANTDCKAEYLEQFAYMGHIYVQLIKKIAAPRVALLSNGHEPYKGSVEVKATYELLQNNKDLNFVGNIEARDMFDGRVDILVTDGFVGNVLLKGIQGTIGVLFAWVRTESQTSWWKKLCGFFAKTLFKSIKQKTDHQRIGGALLLGIKHPVVVAHGCAQADAIMNAIIFAHDTVQSKRIVQFNETLSRLLSARRRFTAAVKQKVQSVFKWAKRSEQL